MNETPTAAPTVKVGSIFRMSWGYGQTNINYFQVTRLTDKGIFIREIASKAVPNTQGMMCQRVVAVPGSFRDSSQWCGKGYNDKNPETFRKIDFRDPRFSIRGRYFASLWTGESDYESWYA